MTTNKHGYVYSLILFAYAILQINKVV